MENINNTRMWGKRIFALLLTILMLLPTAGLSAHAEEITPYAEQNGWPNSVASVSSSGLLTIENSYTSTPGKVLRAEIHTIVEKRTLGILWFDVDNGNWTVPVEAGSYSFSHLLQLKERGTYRVTATFTFYCSDGSTETSKKQTVVKY